MPERDFVYIIDRDGELDVYADLDDARRAAKITGLEYVEQVVFAPSIGDATTRAWLAGLYRDFEPCSAVDGNRVCCYRAGHDLPHRFVYPDDSPNSVLN